MKTKKTGVKKGKSQKEPILITEKDDDAAVLTQQLSVPTTTIVDYWKNLWDSGPTGIHFFSLSFFLSIALIAAYANTSPCHATIREFRSTLNDEQLVKYKDIEQHRRRLTKQGIGVGFLLVAIYIIFIFLTGYSSRFSISHIVFDSLFLWLVTPWIWYMLSPKPVHFLTDVASDLGEVHAWFHVYQCFETRFYSGLVLGVLIALIIFLIIYIFQLAR
ncbi:hypothetical protein EBS02_08490, partial [bacterium]|nr:hypothetical protein [bacterium]